MNFDRIEANQAKINALRPFDGEMLRQVQDYYRVGTTWASNALEGNTLTESETKILLEDGITVGGKPLRDTYEAIGHGKAYDHMFSLLTSDAITLDDIQTLHRLFYQQIEPEQAGKWRTVPIMVSGTDFVFPSPSEVNARMIELEKWIAAERDRYHPVEFAALLHLKFVTIHPFIDGNGRTARLLCNLALIQRGYLPVIVPPILRVEYNDCIRRYQNRNNPAPFVEFIAEQEIETQRGYLRMMHAE